MGPAQGIGEAGGFQRQYLAKEWKSLPQVVWKDRRETPPARSAAGRDSHFQDPRSAISAVGGIWARSQGIGDAFGLEIDDLRLGVGLGFTGVIETGMDSSALTPFFHALV
jgi:hypothetical protein